MNHLKKTTTLFLFAILSLLFTIQFGWWQGTAVGPQIQVPMFYDDHYLYPRPWTQAQEAPGVPPPAPISTLYEGNKLSQTFTPAEQFHLLAIPLAGPTGTPVGITLSSPAGIFSALITLPTNEQTTVYLQFPHPLPPLESTLTLAAPTASHSAPVTAYTIGGDRFGHSIRLNEYPLPGNLALKSYNHGTIGSWWIKTIGEQLFPAPFRLRIQQYKPALFKGNTVLILILSIALGSFLFLVGSTEKRPTSKSLMNWSTLLIFLFLFWQLGSKRLLLFPETEPIIPTNGSFAAGDQTDLLVQDMILTLWTAERKPEARFVTTNWSNLKGEIIVPATSSIRYNVQIPPNGRLRTSFKASNQQELIQFSLFLGQEQIASQITSSEKSWDIDLSPWAGRTDPLTFVTTPISGTTESSSAVWIAPQLSANRSWLTTVLPEELIPTPHRFTSPNESGEIQLLGYQLNKINNEALNLNLYWQTAEENKAYGTFFLHLLDEKGEIVAQQDVGPVNNSYPIPLWPPNQIIIDSHMLILPTLPTGNYQLALGVYNPTNFGRWHLFDSANQPVPDNRLLIQLSIP